VAIREVLHDKINASLVDYANPKAWVDAINYIREHSEYREKDCDTGNERR